MNRLIPAPLGSLLQTVGAFFSGSFIRRRTGRIGWVGLVILILAFLVLLRFSESPRFCNSCHIMRPYYQSWKTSKHNFVPCVDCHYSPEVRRHLWGKFQALSQVAQYVTQTYSTRPYAQIEDASCLRSGCHAKRLIEGKVTYGKGIRFDHRVHLLDLKRGKRLGCTTCHSQIVQGNHLEVTESVCFICHFKPVDGKRSPNARCTLCHELPSKDIVFQNLTFNHRTFAAGRGLPCQRCHLDAIQGEGEALKERCFSCHNKPEHLARFKDVTFMHENHVSRRKVACYQCHQEITHRVTATIQPLEGACGNCHQREHNAQKEMYMGTGGKGVHDMPAPMFVAQVDCVGCHLVPERKGAAEEFRGQTFKAARISCLTCHPKGYEDILDDWQESLKTSLAGLEPQFAAVKSRLDIVPRGSGQVPRGSKNYRQAYYLYKDARHNFDFVKYAHGVHNIDYANTLLEKAKNNLIEARKLLRI